MFDNFRERIKKLEEDHDNLRKIHQHVDKHKVAYAAGGAAIGSGVICIVATRQFIRPVVIHNIVQPVFNNQPVMKNVVNNTVNNVGYCTKIVQDLDDPTKLWPKVAALAAELAEEHNVSFETARTMLSKHLNGHSDNVFGRRFVTYGLGTTG